MKQGAQYVWLWVSGQSVLFSSTSDVPAFEITATNYFSIMTTEEEKKEGASVGREKSYMLGYKRYLRTDNSIIQKSLNVQVFKFKVVLKYFSHLILFPSHKLSGWIVICFLPVWNPFELQNNRDTEQPLFVHLVMLYVQSICNMWCS